MYKDAYERFRVDTPKGEDRVWHRCPACGDEIGDIPDTAIGFETHLSFHRDKGELDSVFNPKSIKQRKE